MIIKIKAETLTLSTVFTPKNQSNNVYNTIHNGASHHSDVNYPALNGGACQAVRRLG